MLTERIIQDHVLKAIASGRQVFKSDGAGGLCLRIGANGHSAFTFMFYDESGRHRERTLGTCPVLSLRQARKMAEALSRALRAGDLYSHEGPLKITTEELFRQWLKVKGSRVTQKTIGKIELRAEKHILPAFGKAPFEELMPRDFFAQWRKLEQLGRHETLMRLCIIVREMYVFGINTGRISGMFDLSHLRDNYAKPRHSHYTAVQPDALGEVFAAVWRRCQDPAAPVWNVLRCACYSLLRQSELSALRWSWYDAASETIVIPAGFMKSQREFVVPVTSRLRALLSELPQASEFVLLRRGGAPRRICRK